MKVYFTSQNLLRSIHHQFRFLILNSSITAPADLLDWSIMLLAEMEVTAVRHLKNLGHDLF